MDGTFHAKAAATSVEVTDLQQSIFNAPLPGSSTTIPTSAPQGLPTKPPPGVDRAMADAGTPDSRGQKRGRDDEDEDEDDSDVAMEEESDDDDE